ncbi:glycosyltransferase [Compostimonas suwonensis]|uniref:D-inositol 3-phosphate glycosyltransferase n=1 Tax=Compostimonas suwonensis TaxID=1048394 RepID=A0A2M9BC90_9MICO|nr:glycosyltransferase [Compostimonas suwonensis]PJJ55556.1 glycosyl transferase family 1 [Compostimonas suwonensis]
MTRPESTTIAFVQPFVPSYRRGLFDAIGRGLSSEGLDLEVWHDQPKGIVASRRNAITGPWSVPIKQHRLTVRRRNVTFRNIGGRARQVKAVVAGLASSNLETYRLALDPSVNLMLWGHGRNFTAGNNSVDERLENWLIGRSTHVFTYTDRGAQHLAASGVPVEKISVVRNSTDTVALRAAQASVEPGFAATTASELSLTPGQVGLFVGAFDEPKRLPFLFAAADRIHERLPGFTLVLAGAGPLDDYVRDETAKRPYTRLVGRLELPELGRMSTVVDVILMPGRVGLVAVDALALGVPLATTRYPFHAPEVDYLNDDNAIWTDDSLEAYAEGVIDVLARPDRLGELKTTARRDGDGFSAEQSAQVFVDGILSGLREGGSHASSSKRAGSSEAQTR